MPPRNANRQRRFQAPLDPVDTVCLDDASCDLASWKELNQLVQNHADTISTRWRKKNLTLRSKCLSRCWLQASKHGSAAPIAETRATPTPGAALSVEDRLNTDILAAFNVEDLSNPPANLLNLIYARASRHPSEFGKWDYENFVKPVLQQYDVVGEDQPDTWAQNLAIQRRGSTGTKVKVVFIGADKEEYGIVKNFTSNTTDYLRGIQRHVYVHLQPEGKRLFQWQKRVVDFCLALVQDIVGNDGRVKPPDKKNDCREMLDGVPDLEQSVQDRTSALLVRPYIAPQPFSIEDAHTQAVTHLRNAEDHLDMLRLEDEPQYLLDAVKERLSVHKENIEGNPPGNAYSGLIVQETLKSIVHDAYLSVAVWNEIVINFEDAELLVQGAGGASEAVDDKLQTCKDLLTILENLIYSSLTSHGLVGCPGVRENFERDARGIRVIKTLPEIYAQNPAIGSLVAIHLNSNEKKNWRAKTKWYLNSLEQLAASNPQLKDELHLWLMDQLTQAASVYELQENLSRHRPGIEADYEESHITYDNMREIINVLSSLWPDLKLNFLGTGEDGFDGLKDLVRDQPGGMKKLWDAITGFYKQMIPGKDPLNDWIGMGKGRLAQQRRGRWKWHGQVWWAEDAAPQQEGVVDTGKGLPALVPRGGFSDAEGYGDDNTRYSFTNAPVPTRRVDVRPSAPSPLAENVPPRVQPEAVKTKPDLTAEERRKLLGKRPAFQEPEFGGPASSDTDTTTTKKEKVKTRGTASESKTDLPSPGAQTASAPSPNHTVSRKTYKALTNLSTGVPMGWKDFCQSMGALGFSIQAVGGSAVRFVPEDREDEPINIHRPHPGGVFGKWQTLWVWRRLKRAYGWAIEKFRVDEGEQGETEKE